MTESVHSLQAPPRIKLSAQVAMAPEVGPSLLWVITGSGQLASITSSGVHEEFTVPKGWRALSVAAARDHDAWISASAEKGGRGLFRFDRSGRTWVRSTRRAPRQIVADRDGLIWAVGKDRLWAVGVRGLERVVSLPREPVDLSWGQDGSLWMAGGTRRYGGFAVWRRDPDRGEWSELPPPAAAIRLACAPDGTAWSVSSRGELWRLHPDGAGSFRECGLDADCRRCLYSRGTDWVRNIGVDRKGVIWVVTDCETGGVEIGVVISSSGGTRTLLRLDEEIHSIAAA